MSDVVNIKIKPFEPDAMIPNKIILIIGPQYSGKSWLTRELLYYMNTPFAILSDPTEALKGFYGDILPKQCKQTEINNDMISKFCNRAIKLAEFNKQYHRKLDTRSLLILDNCVPDLIDMKWERNKNFKFIFGSGKEANMSLVITSPYPLKMPAHYLSSVDYVFILHDNNKKNKKSLWDMFGGMFGTQDQFNDVMDQCTQKYGCMVIDRTKISDKLTDQVYWFKSKEDPKKYYLGSRRLWQTTLNSAITIDELMVEPLQLFAKDR